MRPFEKSWTIFSILDQCYTLYLVNFHKDKLIMPTFYFIYCDIILCNYTNDIRIIGWRYNLDFGSIFLQRSRKNWYFKINKRYLEYLTRFWKETISSYFWYLILSFFFDIFLIFEKLLIVSFFKRTFKAIMKRKKLEMK